MSALTDLRRLMGTDQRNTDMPGTVLELAENGRILVRTQRRTIACTTVIPVSVGDPVRVQGSLIVSRQVAPADSLPEYRV